jgi:hypothetical protein
VTSSRKSTLSIRTALSLLFIFFLLISSNQALALTQALDYATSTTTVRAPLLTLGTGNSSASSLSSTSDYASVSTTAGLTFNENGNVLVPTQAASPAIDGSNIEHFNSATSGSCTFTTTTANDVLYVAISILGTTPTSSVTNSSGASLTQRAAITNSADVRLETWYIIATSNGTQTITVSFATATTFAIIVMGIEQANIPNPFDVTSGNPVTDTGTNTTQSVTVGSILANTLVLGAVAVDEAVTPTIGTGFTRVQRSHSDNLGEAVESHPLTTIANTTTTFTTGITSVNWAMIGDVIWGKLPSLSINTEFATPTTGDNQIISNNQEGYLVSPAYPSAKTIYSGAWQLNLWAQSKTANDDMDIMLIVTDSSYNIVNDVCSKGNTGPIPASTSLITVNCIQPQVNVPSGGHLVIILSNLKSGSKSFTVYWGTQGLTNFRTTEIFNYALRIINGGSSPYNVSFSTYSSSSIAKLTNFTIYSSSPISKCIAITNGVFTQSASPVLTLPGSSTLYVVVDATATDFNSVSNLVLRLKFNVTVPFSYDIINFTVN